MKKQIRILLALVLVLSLGACAPKTTPEEVIPPVVETPVEDEETPPVTESPAQEEEEIDPAPTPENQSEEVTLYFANNKYIETGDEELEKLIPEKREIEHSEVSLEEEIVRALIKGPEDTNNLSTVIPSTVKLIGIEVSGGTAFVNFEEEGMSGASMQEMFTIDQIVASLTERESIERVQFLIDGTKPESLMGHIMADEPFESVSE